MLYRLLRPVVALIVHVFFRRIEIHGKDRIPAGFPLLFAANHPNMLFDPFMIGFSHDRPVYFLAKSTLFGPPVGWLLRSLGGIPVYRRTDDPAQMERNREAFAECHAVLARGEAVGIFPEGKSVYAPHLHPIKTGLARIAFEAEERNGFRLGVKIVPVGLNFLERDKFLSDVLVLFGEPIDPSRHFEAYGRAPEDAVRALTEEVRAALAAITRNLREGQDEAFVGQLRRIYVNGYIGSRPGGPPADLRGTFEVDSALIDAYAHFAREQPERTRRIKRRIESYLLFGDLVGLPEDAIGRFPGLGSLARAVVAGLPVIVLGLPVAAYGWLTNVVPYRLTGILAHRLAVDLSEVAQHKLTVGVALYSLTYAVLGALAGAWAGWPAALAAVLSFPLTGFAALWVNDSLGQVYRTVRATVLLGLRRDLARRMAALRDEIIDELRALTVEWQEARSRVGAGSPSTAPEA